MTREEAIALAREYWGDGRPGWVFDEDRAEYREDTPAVGPEAYLMPSEPHWRIPLDWTVPHVGASHALVVLVGSRTVREIRWGE